MTDEATGMTDEATGRLLGRFVSAVQPVLPLVSVWAHGSLAGGDYQPGRSDLDLIAIVGRPCTAATSSPGSWSRTWRASGGRPWTTRRCGTVTSGSTSAC